MSYHGDYGMAKAQAEYDARMPPGDEEDYHRQALQDEYDADVEIERLNDARTKALDTTLDDDYPDVEAEYDAQIEARKEHLRYLYWQREGDNEE